MLLQTTKRSPCGAIVARVSLCEDWQQFLVAVYKHGTQVSAHYRATRIQAEQDAADACLQPVTTKPELSLVPMLQP